MNTINKTQTNNLDPRVREDNREKGSNTGKEVTTSCVMSSSRTRGSIFAFLGTILLFSTLFFLIPHYTTHAASTPAPNGKYIPLAPIEGISDTSGGVDLGTYLQKLFTFVLGMAGVLAVFMIVAGGFTKMSSDSLFKQNEGTKMITNAVSGLALALGSWLILNTISPNLLKFDFSLGPAAKSRMDAANTSSDIGPVLQPETLYDLTSNAVLVDSVDKIPESGFYVRVATKDGAEKLYGPYSALSICAQNSYEDTKNFGRANGCKELTK